MRKSVNNRRASKTWFQSRSCSRQENRWACRGANKRHVNTRCVSKINFEFEFRRSTRQEIGGSVGVRVRKM
jgi:hypothetical protein